MKDLFFSVIIPCLNEEKYLPRLLTDLTQQKIKPFETIVVDGGSIDNTINQAIKYSTRINLQVIRSQVHNVSAQRNIGARRAQGEYLIFFDADIQVSPIFFQKLVFQVNKHKPLFATTYVRADSRNFSDRVIATFINIGADLSVLIDKPFAGGWNTIVKKDIFWKVNGFREDVKHAEDVDLSLRLNETGYRMKVFHQPRIIYSLRRYRQEGRLKSIRKNALAGLHMFFNGPITKEIFDYPMGGGWYKNYTKNNHKLSLKQKAKKFMKKFREWMEA